MSTDNKILHFFAAVISLSCLAGSQGCQRGDRPEIGAVRGKVTLNGQPLAQATVMFRPVEGGRTSAAITSEQGEYELVYIGRTLGAKLGKHDVRIFTAGEGNSLPEQVPANYNEETELSIDVEEGQNEIDFPLVGTAVPAKKKQ